MFTLTPYVLHNLTSKKATRRYPRQKRSTFENARGELANRIGSCIFCGACQLKCPSQCIQVDKKNAVWTYHPDACVYCGICVEICPVDSLYQKLEYRLPAETLEPVAMQGQLKKKSKKSDNEEK